MTPGCIRTRRSASSRTRSPECSAGTSECGSRRPHAGDEYGDVVVDTAKSREAYLEWMEKTRPAGTTNDSGLRRPLWYARPLKPTLDAYRLPDA